jgi:hypothetical protein
MCLAPPTPPPVSCRFSFVAQVFLPRPWLSPAPTRPGGTSATALARPTGSDSPTGQPALAVRPLPPVGTTASKTAPTSPVLSAATATTGLLMLPSPFHCLSAAACPLSPPWAPPSRPANR